MTLRRLAPLFAALLVSGLLPLPVLATAPPDASANPVTTLEDQAAIVTVSATDPDGGTITSFDVDAAPTKGSLGSFSAIDCASSAAACTAAVTYTPNPNANGSDTFDFTATDSDTETSAPATASITITPVNDNPTANDDTLTVNEDSGTVSHINVLANDSDAPDSGEVLDVASVGSASHGTAVLHPVQGVRYTPAANYHGSDSFTYTIEDGNGGTDTATVDVTVNSVNDPPTANDDSSAILEDAATTVVDVLANDSIAPDTGETLTVTAVGTATKGTPAISIGAGSVTYTPDADANGADAFTYTASDGNGGTDTASVAVTITPVNDAPSFTKGADQQVDQNAGAQSVPGWATSISKGPSNESAQVLTFVVVADDTALFSAQPTVAADGTLAYTPADASGSTIVSIHAEDDGGVANGGVDASPTQTFTVTVGDVNVAPAFTPGADESILEDAGAQSVPDWATGISAGPADESGQVLAFEIASDSNPSMFAVAPAVDPDGDLTYTPADDANGTALIGVRLTDDGGTANGGSDTSPTHVLTITIGAVNDAPSFTKGADATSAEDAVLQTIAGWATAISSGPADESAQILTFEVTDDDNSSLFAQAPAVDATGALTFRPATNHSGTATITIRLVDDGGVADGGSDTSPGQTFTITVSGTNDPPVAANDLLTVHLAGPTALDVRANDNGGPGEPGDPIVITGVKEGSRGIVTITGGGTSVTYDPIGCTTGSDTFTYTLTDGGSLTDAATVLVSIANPTAYPVADGPRPGFVTNSSIGSTTPVRMTWCGLTSGTTIKSYRLYQSTNGGSFSTVISSTTATSSTRNLGSSHYQFRARVTDNKGRTATGTGPLFRVVRTQDSSSAISYSTGWSKTTAGSPSGGSARTTSTQGKSATLTYSGRSFAIVGTKGSSRGSFNVYVDGVKVTSSAVSAKASTTQYRRVLYARTLAAGSHTIKVVAVGNGRVDLDAILTVGS